MTKRFVVALGRAFITISLVLAVSTVAGLVIIKARGGRVMIVASGSMEPTFSAGGVVLVRDVAAPDLRPGMVVTFRAAGDPGNLTTHRILTVRPRAAGLFLQTKGDANATADPNFVHAGAVVGSVERTLPVVGRWLSFFQAPLGRLLILGLPLALIAIAQARALWLARPRRVVGAGTDDERGATDPAATRPAMPLLSWSTTVTPAITLVLAVAAGTAIARYSDAQYTNAEPIAANAFTTSTNSCTGPSTYAATVLADNPIRFHRFSETSGTVAADSSPTAVAGTYTGGYTQNRPGATSCETSRAVGLNGSSGHVPSSTTVAASPLSTFSIEAWFRTGIAGGKIVGFGNSRTGTSGSYDRHLYLNTSGQVVFGVYPGAVRILSSPAVLTDNRWHHAVGTLGPAGMNLYVDGVLVASRTDTTTAQTYNGYWRIGRDNTSGWTNSGNIAHFTGDIDEVAVYAGALSAPRVAAHYAARRN
jgi:signal peptidase I